VLRPSAHTTGELGEAIFVTAMLRHKWIVTKLTPDYGFDFLGQPAVAEHVANTFALFQIKARATRLARGKKRSVRIASSHLEFWYDFPAPAFVVNVECATRSIFLRSCQEVGHAAGSRMAATRAIEFPDHTRLTRTSEARLRAGVIAYWQALHGNLGAARGAMIASLNGSFAVPPLSDSDFSGLFMIPPWRFGRQIGTAPPITLGNEIEIAIRLMIKDTWSTRLPIDVGSFKSWLLRHVVRVQSEIALRHAQSPHDLSA